MSQFPSPSSIFNAPSVDYTAAEVLVKQMVSYVNANKDGCCASKNPQYGLNQVNPILSAMSYDSADDLDNDARWQADVKSSYYIIYPYT